MKLKPYFVPEYFVYEDIGKCLSDHPEQAATTLCHTDDYCRVLKLLNEINELVRRRGKHGMDFLAHTKLRTEIEQVLNADKDKAISEEAK